MSNLPNGDDVHPMIRHCARILRENPNIKMVQLTQELHLQSIATAGLWRLRTEQYLASLIPEEPDETPYTFDADESTVVDSEAPGTTTSEEPVTRPWWKNIFPHR